MMALALPSLEMIVGAGNNCDNNLSIMTMAVTEHRLVGSFSITWLTMTEV